VHVAPRAGLVDPLVTARAVVDVVDDVGPQAVLFWNVIAEHKILVADLLLGVPVWDVSPGEMYFASLERYFRAPRVGSPYLAPREYGALLAGAIVKYEAERTRAEEILGAPVSVVTNGVPVPAYAPRARRGRVVVGTLARISPDKKLEQLVDAASPDFDVRIAGDIERGCETYAAELRGRSPHVTWVGELEATTFLADCDLFAMVSEPAGCPNASLEAMAASLAVVATDAGGAREQIVHGETGLLVPRGDVRAFGAALAELAADHDRRDAMGRAAHARARDLFSVERMARDYARLCLGLETPAHRVRPELPHREQRFREDLATHLRLASRAIDEDDRDFLHAEAFPHRAELHLDLEQVSARTDRFDVDRLERMAREPVVTAGEIADADAEHRA
jgi:glycosyltransferase involved in cell wall biosynthesis